jgi:predicted  nucleic acid-binding Zn-ribbon protein
MDTTNTNKTRNTVSDQEFELESLTKQYISGEIELEEYQKKVSRLKTRLDLRRVASKLRPILTPSNSSK